MKKKLLSLIKKLFVIILVLSTIVVIIGFLVPGLIWTKNLGVKYTKKDYESIVKKLGYIKDLSPTGKYEEYNYNYTGINTVNTELTSEELTAFFNYNRPEYYPLKNVQIKVSNNKIEAVAQVNTDYILNDFLSAKFTRSEIEKNIPGLGLLPEKINLYLNFSGSLINNKSSVKIDDAQIQGLSIPNNYINEEAFKTISDSIDNVIFKFNEKAKSNFRKIAILENKIGIEADLPSKLERVKK